MPQQQTGIRRKTVQAQGSTKDRKPANRCRYIDGGLPALFLPIKKANALPDRTLYHIEAAIRHQNLGNADALGGLVVLQQSGNDAGQS